jgi:hypothetical protein
VGPTVNADHAWRCRFPVVCPSCGEESLVSHDLSEILICLLCSRGIELRSPCHDVRWNATLLETAQIDEYCRAKVFYVLG